MNSVVSLFAVVIVLIAASITSCREYEVSDKKMLANTSHDDIYTWDHVFEDQKSTNEDNVSVSTVNLQSQIIESKECVVEVNLHTGCQVNPSYMAIANKHETQSPCEHLTSSAIYAYGYSESYEDVAPFEWLNDNPEAINLVCSNLSHQDNCHAFGLQDFFDATDGHEPSSQVTACTTNTCETDSSCEQLVCNSVTVTSVVNLEGLWLFFETFNQANLDLNFLQDGRFITDETNDVKHGYVINNIVRFEIDDFAYLGIISPERDLIEGTVIELMLMNEVGSWHASRSSL